MTDPIGTAQERELIERLERSIASNGAWMTSDIRAFYEALRDALQSRIAEVGRLEPKATSYDWAHEDAVEMGYPSLTEALEDLERLRNAKAG